MNKFENIYVPNDANPESWFNFLIESRKLLEQELDEIVIDFNTVDYLHTDDIVVLSCLLDSFFNKKIKITFINGTKRLKNHLKKIKFRKYWTDEFDRDKFTLIKTKNVLCLWHISEEMISTYSEYAKKYYEKNFFNNKDLLPLSTNLSELFNNIFDHSKSMVNGYIITQYYPKNNRLSFSICDFGIGIADKLNNYYEKTGKPIKNDSETLKESLITGVSSFSTERNRGFGLSYVLEFTESFKGCLTIISNNGYLIKEFDKDYHLIDTNYNFKGTLIKAEVNTLTFEEKDEEEFIYEM